MSIHEHATYFCCSEKKHHADAAIEVKRPHQPSPPLPAVRLVTRAQKMKHSSLGSPSRAGGMIRKKVVVMVTNGSREFGASLGAESTVERVWPAPPHGNLLKRASVLCPWLLQNPLSCLHPLSQLPRLPRRHPHPLPPTGGDAATAQACWRHRRARNATGAISLGDIGTDVDASGMPRDGGVPATSAHHPAAEREAPPPPRANGLAPPHPLHPLLNWPLWRKFVRCSRKGTFFSRFA